MYIVKTFYNISIIFRAIFREFLTLCVSLLFDSLLRENIGAYDSKGVTFLRIYSTYNQYPCWQIHLMKYRTRSPGWTEASS